MAYSLVSPNTFALNLKLHCKICEKTLKNMLLKIQGVHSVKIDEKLGNVVISGTVDPATILTMLEKLGRKAELLWEQGTPIKNEKNVQIITQSKVIDPLHDPEIMTQVEQLSGIPGLQTIEVTRTIKLTFQGESRNEPADKVLEISTTNNLNKPHHQFEQFEHSHGDGFCAASSSCCGGHAAINQSHNLHGCCHGGNTSNFGSCCANSRNCCCEHRPPPMENWGRARPSNSQPPPLLTAQSWSSGSSIASAPPLPSDYFQGPPSPPSSSSQMLNTCYSALSDENANGCIIQ
ncbi:uncharacterized protein LOC132068194 [Lycium ferocissimum]|uniref:uncharacterized protein LOC132068194 n=1 Tax=Lycium ferocissimum TaxID=112874 RepID=UPI002814CB8A|nr:uncharacterized protein LOC132068194 [Lycium ferocissimum]XP_059317687.1 uncharacterized protein LOC132068194 [Lycium ferocissimum]